MEPQQNWYSINALNLELIINLKDILKLNITLNARLPPLVKEIKQNYKTISSGSLDWIYFHGEYP